MAMSLMLLLSLQPVATRIESDSHYYDNILQLLTVRYVQIWLLCLHNTCNYSNKCNYEHYHENKDSAEHLDNLEPSVVQASPTLEGKEIPLIFGNFCQLSEMTC